MKNKTGILSSVFTVLFCISSLLSFSQNTLTVLGKEYPAISFVFTTYTTYADDERLFPDKDVNVIIAKNNNSGFLQLSINSPADKDLCGYFRKCGISGDIILKMANGDTIVCKDQGMNDFIEGLSTAIYRLTPRDMKLLQSVNIEVIQFYMRTFNKKGDFLAANFQHSFSSTPDEFTQKNENVSITKVPRLMKKL